MSTTQVQLYRADGEQIIVEVSNDNDYIVVKASNGEVTQIPCRTGAAELIARSLAETLQCPIAR